MHFNEIEGSLADRKLIATELTEKMPLLLELLNNEMDQAKEIFDQQEVFFYTYFFSFRLLEDLSYISGPSEIRFLLTSSSVSGTG